MLGRTAAGLFWMARLLERAENTSRLVEAGFRMALTRSQSGEEEWRSVLVTAGCCDAYLQRHETIQGEKVADFALRDRTNPSSVISALHAARENARMTRTALTREMWEAINDFWMAVRDVLKVAGRRFPGTPILIAQTLVQGDEAPAQVARAIRRVAGAPRSPAIGAERRARRRRRRGGGGLAPDRRRRRRFGDADLWARDGHGDAAQCGVRLLAVAPPAGPRALGGGGGALGGGGAARAKGADDAQRGARIDGVARQRAIY